MSAPRRPLPPELQSELSQHTGGHELAQVWELLALADPVPGSSEADAVWSRISADIARGRPLLTPVAGSAALPPTLNTPRRAPSVQSRSWRPAVMAIAATLALLVGTGTWAARPVVVNTPLGQQESVTLPDGSVAELNAGSTLRYRAGLRGRLGLPAAVRELELEGEAFFDVVPNRTPFEVRTAEARVTVLGTRFLVRARADERDGTSVAVESGRVRVTPQGAASEVAVVLQAGQGTVVGRGVTAPTPVSVVGVERLTLWRRGGFALVDQPLDAIVRELERRYALDIGLANVPVGEERLSVYYPDRPSIETVLSDLCTPRGLRFSRTSRGYEISPSVETPLPTP